MDKLTEQNLTKLSPAPLLNYFKVILNIGWALCLIPFRLVEGRSHFVISTHRAQQIACGFVHFIVLYRLFSAFRFLDFGAEMDAMSKSHQLSRTGLVHIGYIIDIVYGLGFVYTVWAWAKAKRRRMYKMISLIENLDVLENRGRFSGFKIKMLALSMCFLLAVFAITDIRLHGSSLANGDLWKYFTELHEEAQQYYLFRDPKEPIEGIGWNILAVLFTAIHFVTGLPHFTLVHVLELFLVLTVICLRHIIKDFLRFCKKSGNIDEALVQYETLKQLVKTVNGLIRILLLCCVGVSLPFYTFWAAVVYFEEHVIIHFFIHFGTFFILLIVAAEFNTKATKFYTWISSLENVEVLSSNRLVSLNMDMNSNQLAIRGSGFFTMTYRFFETILSVLVTYTVIIIQFQVTRQGFYLTTVATGAAVEDTVNSSVHHNHLHNHN